MPENVSWRLEQQDRKLDLIVENASINFDLSKTFERIPRTRLRAVEEYEFGIRFLLACSCPVRRVEGIAGQVVLDIVSPTTDRKDASWKDKRVPVARPRPRPADTLMAGSPIAQSAGSALAKVLRGAGPPQRQEPLNLLTLPYIQEKSAQNDTLQAEDEARSVAVAQSLADGLEKAISGATARNLLSVNKQFTGTAVMSSVALPKAAADHLPPRGTLDPTRLLDKNICSQAASNFIPDWDNMHHETTGEQNWSALYDPLDRLDSEATRSLGASILRMGFGAEARALFLLLPSTDQTASLQAISYLMDHEQPPAPDALLQFSGCSEMDTLWAFLAVPEKTIAMDDARNRIVRATQALPNSIRTHLGPVIVRLLLRQNAPETANLVQASVERSEVQDRDSSTRAAPDLLLAVPEQIIALEANPSFDLSDEDLLMFLENAEARGLEVPSSILDFAMERQFAYRRSEIGKALAVAVARALARAREFNAAFRMAASRDSALTDDKRRALVRDLLRSLVENSSDTIFVTTLFDHMPKENGFLTASLAAQISTRLADLGFEKEAKDLSLRALSSPEPLAIRNERISIDGFDTAAAQINSTSSPLDMDRAREAVVAAEQPGRLSPFTRLGTAALQQDLVASSQSTAAADNSEVADVTSLPSGNPQGSDTAGSPLIDGTGQSTGREAGLLEQGRSSLRDAGELRSQLERLLE